MGMLSVWEMPDDTAILWLIVATIETNPPLVDEMEYCAAPLRPYEVNTTF